MTKVFISSTKKGINEAVKEVFTNLEKDGLILNSSKDVYIKVNGINIYPHVHTSPEVLEVVIKYLKDKAGKIYVMENASQCAVTRVVFAATGYKEICDKLGAEMALSGVPGFDLLPNVPPDQYLKLVGEARKHGTTALF